MGTDPAASPEGLTPPPIPEDGLHWVLSAWSGRGQLLEALAAVAGDEPAERLWNARDIRRRVHRVLFEQMLPVVAALPATRRRWTDVLPAESSLQLVLHSAPRGRVDVVRTRLRGWPPDSFVVRQRTRIAEELLATATAWTLRELATVADDAAVSDPLLVEGVRAQLTAAGTALSMPPLAAARREVPDRATLSALKRAGPPWASVARIAVEMLDARRTPAALADRLIEPDAKLRWRLFHLGVLGDILLELAVDGPIASLTPLSTSASGPNYRTLTSIDPVEVWFEAARVWHDSKATSPYMVATAGLQAAGRRPLGPDVLLLRDTRALVVECKYSNDSGYIATGYEQVIACAAELRGTVADDVVAVVVGPDGVVTKSASASTAVGAVHVVPAGAVRPLIREWL